MLPRRSGNNYWFFFFHSVNLVCSSINFTIPFVSGYSKDLPAAISIMLWQLLACTKSECSFLWILVLSNPFRRLYHLDSGPLTWKLQFLWSDSIEVYSTSSHLLCWEESLPTYSFSACKWFSCFNLSLIHTLFKGVFRILYSHAYSNTYIFLLLGLSTVILSVNEDSLTSRFH